MTRYSVGSEIVRNNSHTDLPVVHQHQPVPTCFIYERLMNRYPLRAVTLANWPEVPASASTHTESAAQLQQETEADAAGENLVGQP